jgi:hypothetical protein
MSLLRHKTVLLAFVFAAVGTLLATSIPQTRAADHSEAPIADENRGEDIADVYAFLDPNDSSKLVIAATLVGFIVPSENVNQGVFDSKARFRFEFEETGDARPDRFLQVTFAPRTSPTSGQTATITLPGGQTFTAPTTPPSLAAGAPAPTVTTNAATGVQFFAGLTDDPFFFDIPGFNRFAASVLGGAPDASQLNRGRDSFAGYNVLTIAFSIPTSLLTFSADVIGVHFIAQLPNQIVFKRGEQVAKGKKYFNADRMGNPAVNTVLVPFARKDEYNQASPADDAAGVFLTDLAGTLGALGTDSNNTTVLASVAVVKGDMLRVNRTVQNTGSGGGSNDGAGFPNGRRPGDDVIDTLLGLVTNGLITAGDHVDSNDRTFASAFPFLATPHQPLPAGASDGTENKTE